MRLPARLVLLATLLLPLLAACTSTGGKRVSEPAASIQQLTIDARGGWQVQLRLQNYSSVAMRFDSVDLALEIDGQPAGKIAASPTITVPAESADITTISHAPSAEARMAVATALSSGHGIGYKLTGSVNAAPESQKPRVYTLEARNQLNPVPGLPGVFR